MPTKARSYVRVPTSTWRRRPRTTIRCSRHAVRRAAVCASSPPARRGGYLRVGRSLPLPARRRADRVRAWRFSACAAAHPVRSRGSETIDDIRNPPPPRQPDMHDCGPHCRRPDLRWSRPTNGPSWLVQALPRNTPRAHNDVQLRRLRARQRRRSPHLVSRDADERQADSDRTRGGFTLIEQVSPPASRHLHMCTMPKAKHSMSSTVNWKCRTRIVQCGSRIVNVEPCPS
jgi:hypothetical protein